MNLKSAAGSSLPFALRAYLRKAQRVFPLILSAAAFFAFSACASFGGHYSSLDAKAFNGDFAEAFAELIEDAARAYSESDALLFQLDSGMLAHFAGLYGESKQYLEEAERNIEYLAAKSVSLTAASYLANDTITEYSGEDYEDIYINVFNALNYYHLGLIDDAAVEVRRIDEKLKVLSARHGTEITQVQQALLENGTEVPYDIDAASMQFSNSALARYLGMLFYRAKGLYDDARIDMEQVRLAFANQPAVYDFPPPSSINEEASIPRGKARINFISFTGLGPEKEEETFRVPIGGGKWIKVSLPVMRKRSGKVAQVKVLFDSGEQLDLEIIEKMDAVAAEAFKQNEAAIYLKTVLRAATKTAASVAFDEAARQVDDDSAFLLLSVLSLGTQLYADFSEQADLRISHYFPATAWVGGITVDPGVYSFSVVYYSSSGKILHRERFENIRADEGRLNLAESVCIR